MPSKQSQTARAAAKTSSSNTLSATALTASEAKRSALLKHSFAPSRLALNLFASVVQGLEAQVLRCHDTLTGKLTCEHSLGDGRVSCLDWGYCGSSDASGRPSKKRKTKEGGAEARQELGQGNPVIAIGTSNAPEIELYSPARDRVVAILEGAHTQGIRDFKFLEYGISHKAWSLGGDGKLVEWNTQDGSAIRTIALTSSASSSTLISPQLSTILCAHTAIYAVDPESPTETKTFSGFAAPLLCIAAQTNTREPNSIAAILGAAESERYINVFDYQTQRIQGNLVAADVIQSISTPDSTTNVPILAAITERGAVEIFDTPFDFKSADTKAAKSMKASKQAMTRRPRATIRITRPGKATETVPVVSAIFDGNHIVICWIEGAVNPCFDRIPWRTAGGSLVLNGIATLEKAKSQSGLVNAKMNGLQLGQTQVDDSQTVVVKGGNLPVEMDVDGPEVIDISSAEDPSSDEEEEEEEAQDAEGEEGAAAAEKLLTNGIKAPDTDMGNASDDEASEDENKEAPETQEGEATEEENEEPSFGDLLRAKLPDPVDVSMALPTKAQTALVPQGEKSLRLPSGMSLGTVLAQSLRTNDRELLETCFHVQDLQIVRATIERLDGTLAGSLLEKLAERLHNRPGRAGSLMVWIQWTLITHGGYLAGQPRVVKQLRQLHGVVKERAQALQPLLLLKGKLDMLEAQMTLRRRIVATSKVLAAAREDAEEEAIYIEGQEEESSEEEEVEGRNMLENGASADEEDLNFDTDDEEDESMEMPTAMEVDEDEEEEDEDDESDDGGLLDDEAEETENDTGDEDDVDHDDVDSIEEAESEPEEPEPKPKSKSMVNGVVKKR